MIFNKEFDESLYLILKYDKKNRRDIVRLLSGMPKDFYSCILNTLNNSDSNEIYKWENEYATSKYIFTIDKDVITINMEDKRLGDKLELSLSSYDFINKDIVSSSLGSFTKKVFVNRKKDNRVVEHEKTYKYDMMNMPREQIFYRVKDTKKSIVSFPMIREIKQEESNELTLKLVNEKFDKKKKRRR